MIPTSRKLANSVYRLERLAGFQRKTEENAQERKTIHYCLPMKTKNILSLCPTSCSRPVFKNKSSWFYGGLAMRSCLDLMQTKQ